jgi:dTDP-4-dehydrorhamnose reductase
MSDTTVRPSDADEQIFVVGADGMLGRRLVTAFAKQGRSVWESTRNPTTAAGKRVYLDLANDVDDFVPPFLGAGTAILCAANTSIDHCQREPQATRRINVDHTVALARNLIDAAMFVVFISSNTVFDGSAAFAGSGDKPNPQHEYGRQKADAEAQLLDMGKNAAVIRFGKIIAPGMPLLSGWIRDLRAGETVHAFSDAVMAPVSADFAAEVICRLDTYKRAGVTQASASEDITYANAARYLARVIAADVNLIRPVSSRKAGIPAVPEHTTLNTSELLQLGLEAPLPTNALDQFL